MDSRTELFAEDLLGSALEKYIYQEVKKEELGRKKKLSHFLVASVILAIPREIFVFLNQLTTGHGFPPK
jgi:hypothetical protein